MNIRCFLILAGMIFCMVSCNNEERYGLIFSNEEIDIGSVKIKDTVQVNFNYLNNSRKNIVITNIESSCGCILKNKYNRIVKKGERDSLKIYFVPTEKGEFRKNIVIRSTSENEFNSVYFIGSAIN